MSRDARHDVLNLLRQDRIWVDKSGRTWPVERMSRRHRRNLLRWLERHAARLAWSWSGRFVTAPDDVWAQVERDLTRPREWLEEFPLVVRLRRLQRPFGRTREAILHTVRDMIQ